MDKVRIGIIGVGGMGYSHCKQVNKLEETELVCVADIDEEVARARGEEFGVKYFTNHKDLIDSGLCDAVIIATPHWVHPEIAIYAFEKGLHVLSEKPIAVRVSDADRMIEASEKYKKTFAVMFQRRAEWFVRKAKEIVDSGKIGEVLRTVCIDPWYRSQAYYNSATWRATWIGEGGGVLINQAPHTIDIFTYLAGLPAKVEAKTRTRLHDIEVEDEVSAHLEYKNGAWGYYYTSTCEPGNFYLEVSGDKGRITIKENTITFHNYETPLKEFTVKAPNMWASLNTEEEKITATSNFPIGHAVIIKNFANNILNGEKLIAPGKEGLNSVEFINACILSGKKNKVVDVPVDRKEYDELMEELKKISKPKKVVKVIRETDPKFKK